MIVRFKNSPVAVRPGNQTQELFAMEGDTRRNTRSPAARLSGQTAERSDGKPAAAAAQDNPARGLQMQEEAPESSATVGKYTESVRHLPPLVPAADITK